VPDGNGQAKASVEDEDAGFDASGEPLEEAHGQAAALPDHAEELRVSVAEDGHHIRPVFDRLPNETLVFFQIQTAGQRGGRGEEDGVRPRALAQTGLVPFHGPFALTQTAPILLPLLVPAHQEHLGHSPHRDRAVRSFLKYFLDVLGGRGPTADPREEVTEAWEEEDDAGANAAHAASGEELLGDGDGNDLWEGRKGGREGGSEGGREGGWVG
jgi:hypothetical protein